MSVNVLLYISWLVWSPIKKKEREIQENANSWNDVKPAYN